MAESIGTARLDIVVDTSSMDAGVTKAKRSTADMAKAAQDASQKMDAGTKRQVQALERQIATLGKSRAEVIKWRIEQQTSGRVAAELTAKLDAQARRVSSTNALFERAGHSAGRMIRRWAALAAATVSVGAAAAGLKTAIDFADQLDELSNRLGVSTEQLSAWGYAAKLSGTDLEALSGAIPKLSKSMAAALDDGSKMAGVFKSIGVAVKDSSGRMRDVEQVLPEIADAFKRLDNDTLEAALSMELFGRSGTDMLEFLNRGGDGLKKMGDRARELGIVVNGDAAGAAAKFNDTLDDLKAASTGLFVQVAQALLPEMTKLVAKLSELVSDGERTKKFVSDLSTVVSGSAKVFEFAGGQLAVMTSQLAALKTAADGVINLDWSQINRGLAMGLAAQMRNSENLGRLFSSERPTAATTVGDQMDITLGAPMTPEERAAFDLQVTGALGGNGRGGKSKSRKRPDFAKDAAEELAKLMAVEDNATKAFLRMEAALNGPLAVAMLDHKERVAELNELASKSPAAAEGLAKALELEAERYAKVTKEIERQQNPLALLLDDMKFELDMIGRGNAERVVMNELRRNGIDLMSKEAQAALATARAYEMEAAAKGRSIGLMDDFRQGAENALVDFVTGAKSASDALKDFFDELAKQVTRAIANKWIEQAFGSQGQQGGGAAGDWVGSLLGALAGGWKDGGAFYNGRPVEMFANGGIFDRPTMFGMSGGRMGVMGEAGPEAIMPLERGRDGRLGVRASGGASVQNNSIQQVVYVQGKLDGTTLGQMARKTGKEAAREIARTGR